MRNYLLVSLSTLPKAIAGSVLISALAACGGGGTAGSSGVASSSSEQGVGSGPSISKLESISLSGSVGDGPIVNAEVNVFNNKGNLMASMNSDAFANYSLNFKTRSNPFPVIVEASRGTDLVSGSPADFALKAVALTKLQRRVNLNPFSTMIVEAARAMPNGLTNENVTAARNIILQKLSFGLDTSSIADPMTATIDENNIANIVRASEALGETIRRTRTALSSAGVTASHDEIVTAIAHDMVDGRMDGTGGRLSDKRVTAAASVAAAQVLIETLQNNLYVNGSPSVAAMDSAIVTTLPGTPSNALTDSVVVTEELVAQTARVLTALQVIDARPEIVALVDNVEAISVGSLPAEVRTRMDISDSRILDTTLTTVSQADEATLNTITSSLATNSELPINTNQVPTISGAPQTSINANAPFVFTPVAYDADGDILTFSIANKPVWMTFDPATGRLSGTPTNANAGTYGNIILGVSDGAASVALPAFSLTVSPVNSTPSIWGTPATTVAQGATYWFQPSTSDVDGDPLTFSISNKPAWLTFNTSTGRLSGTPSNSNVGTYGNIVVSVSDGSATASLPAFNLTVTNVNDAPVISGSPATAVAQGSTYVFQPVASDADGNALVFSITNRPSWMTFSTSTGRLSGTPTNSNVGSYTNIVIRVSDGVATASLPAFGITVSNVNDAPTVSGTPATSVDAGSAYSFAPTAVDVDGDTVTFSIVNCPPWASFNTTTGRLSGTPTEANVGVYGNIVISANDGQATAQMAPFSITVNTVEAVPRDVTLRWVAPTARTDGTALSLSEIAGFRIAYGTGPGNYTNSISVNDPAATTYTLQSLPAATYYFVVTSIDTNGQESSFSGSVSTTVQ